jgi:2,4-dienoyl-CoA reductase-like NADH-dependent reductase (Old Yellow Enzyme family)
MTEEDIQDVINRFVFTAKIARESGFDGIQLHSAHGYLLSQFLSPDINQRTDAWGGSLKTELGSTWK